MNLPELASLIIDVSETFDPDQMISLSAQPDNQIICQYFCDPRSGVSILRDYAPEKLDQVFLGCNSLADATAKVDQLYRESPLDADELRCVQTASVQAVMNATFAITNHRGLGGCKRAHDEIVAFVVAELKSHLSTFQH